MEFTDYNAVARTLQSLMDDLGVLQIKVGALESLILKDDETRNTYTRIVNEQVEKLLRERRKSSLTALPESRRQA
jgi:hypothetical protein